jgi:type IV pilus assembly protein PilE
MKDQSSKRLTTAPAVGFTLIELMVVVAIVAILAAIVVPNYSDYVRRSSLNEGFAALADGRVKLEQFYQSNRNYGLDGAAIPCGNDGVANRIDFAGSSQKFTVTCSLTGTGALNQAYVITATGSVGPAIGHTYTLDSNNVKSTTQFKGAAANKSCWLVKGNEC